MNYTTANIQPNKSPLFNLLWLVYFAANLGRLSYVASMVEIINSDVISPVSAGLVATGFFVCYGVGQLGAGFLGERINPRRLIFIGMFFTALANLAMAFTHTSASMLIIWSFNGLIQSIIWPPFLRVMVEYFAEPTRTKICTNIATTQPAAVIMAYLSCAGIITILQWRAVFIIFALFLFIVSVVWVIAFKKFSPISSFAENAKQEAAFQTAAQKKSNIPSCAVFAIVFFCLALIMQGALRDGLMAWMPVYTARVFLLSSNTAILTAGILPMINLAGIYVCRFIFNRIKNEGKTSILLFSISSAAALILRFFGEHHILLSLFAFAMIAACMTGINLMLVTFVPSRFSKFGLVSFMTGLNNSMVYVGSSISVFGIALLVERSGWEGLLTMVFILGIVSILFCILASRKWTVFTNNL